MIRYKLLPRNARTCIAVEPLWALFGPMVSYFMPLYQQKLGLGEVQMGFLNSVGIATGLVFYTLASPITDKLGRRRTSLIFDLLSWTVSMLLWAFARSYLLFFLAAVFNSIVRIVVVSWNLLISEDADQGQRGTIFGWINIIGTFGGLTTLLGGMLIDRFGVVPSMRVLFLVGAFSMTCMFFGRYYGTQETTMGRYLQEKTKDKSLAALTLRQIPRARESFSDPFFRRMTGIYFVVNAIVSIDFFRVLYLTQAKALPALTVSSVPALSSLASFVLFFFVLPRQKQAKAGDHLSLAFAACILFQILFILMPRGSSLAAILVFPSLQASYALLAAYRDTVFMNGTDPERLSERFSLIQSLMMLLCIPIGWAAGLLYSLSPHLPFLLSLLLYGFGFFLSRAAIAPRQEAGGAPAAVRGGAQPAILEERRLPMDLNGLDFTEKEGTNREHDVLVFALSTCGHCKRALAFLDEKGVAYRYLYVDKIPLERKTEIKAELKNRFDVNVAFPFAVIDGKSHLVGFIEPDWVLSLGLGDKK